MGTMTTASAPAHDGLRDLLAAASATHNAVLTAIETLEEDGYQQAATHLRRRYSIWPKGHVCTFNDAGCCDCGSSL